MRFEWQVPLRVNIELRKITTVVTTTMSDQAVPMTNERNGGLLDRSSTATTPEDIRDSTATRSAAGPLDRHLPLAPAVSLPDQPDDIAPDGSEVRVLARTDRASMAHFRLAPGQASIGVVHRTVEEIWVVTAGEGWIWRCLPENIGDGQQPDLRGVEDKLRPGVSIPIPVGTHFQFRAADNVLLDIVGVTMPPWPGQDEAVRSDIAPWKPSFGVVP